MQNISIISKESHQVLEKVTSNNVGLTENSVVLVQVSKEDVASITRENNNALINLRNGEVIVLQNFFSPEFPDNSLVFEDQDGALNWVKFTNADGTIAETIQYYPIQEIEPLLYSDNFVGGILPWLAAGGVAGAVAAAANDSNSKPTPNPPVPTPKPDTLINVPKIYDDVDPKVGPVLNGESTNDTQPTISGTGAQAGAIIKVYNGNQLIGETVALADGTWSLTPTVPFVDGTYNISATQTIGGKESDKSSAINFTVDTKAPDKITIDPIGKEDGETNIDKPKISGDSEPKTTVEIKIIDKDGNVIDEKTVPTDDKGKWEYIPDKPFKEGDFKIIVTPIDGAGNKGEKTEKNFVIDLTDPDVDIDPINSTATFDSITPVVVQSAITPLILKSETSAVASIKNTTPTFTGNTKDSSRVEIVIRDKDGKVVTSGTATLENGKWSFKTPVELAEGNFTIEATAFDKAGNNKTAKTNFTVDITPPSIEMNELPLTNLSAPTFQGKTKDGATLVKVDIKDATGKVVETANVKVAADGSWSYVPKTPLADGNYTVEAMATDAAGNVSPKVKIGVTVDTIDPDVTIDPLSDSSNVQPAITGKTEPGAKVNVEIVDKDGKVVATGPATVNADGTWSYTPTTPLAEGKYSISAEATDKAGNTGKTKESLELNIDTTPPSDKDVTVNPIADTNDKTPAITGTTEAGTTVTVVVRDKDGNVVATGPATVTDKTWTYTPSADLKDGDYTVTAEAKDKAGNTGTSKPVTFEVDTVAPDLTINDLKDTNDTTPTVSGKTEPGAKVNVEIVDKDGKVVATGPATVNADGTWSYTPTTPLAEGEYKIKADATDAVGNKATATTATGFNIDITPPSDKDVTVNPIADTNDKTPAITGTTEAGTTVTVVVRDKDGNVVATGPATVTDKTWTYTPSADLKDGDYTVTAEAKDKAGNTGTSKPVTFEVDTVAPDASIDDLKPTNDTTPTVSGKTEPGAKIAVVITDETGKIISEGQATVNPDGTWSYTPPTPLPEGNHKIEVTPSDKAGNEGSKVIAPLVIDTTPPDNASIDPIGGDDFESNESKPKITGQSEPNSKVDIIITGPNGFEEKVTVPVDDKGNWTHTPTAALKEGDYKIIVTPIDEAGNKGNPTEQKFSIDLTEPDIDFDPFDPVVPFVEFDDLNSDDELVFDEVFSVKSAAFTEVADAVEIIAGPVLFANDPSIPYTNNPQRTFTGPSKDANVITVVYKNAAGEIISSGFADIKGDRWSYTPKQPLVEGIYTIEVQAKDKAGNTSKPAIQKFGVDITAPDLNINELKPTNDATPLISGKTEANTTVKVEIKDGNGVTVDTGTAVVDGSGNWTYVPRADIKDGNYTVQATSTDSAKNQTTASQKLTIDTVAPGLVVINPVVQTGNLKPALTGTAEANAIVDLIIKDATGRVIDQAKVQVNPNGSWSFVPTKDLPEGTILVEAKATDKAGNTGQTSSTNFILDVTPPDAPTANFNADGSFVNGTAQPLSTVKIKDASGNVIGTAVAANNGQYSIKLTPSLNDAQKVSVTATDLAGESPAKLLTAPNILVDAVDNVTKAEIEWSYPVQTNTQTDVIKFNWLASFFGITIGQKSGQTTITIKETTDLQVIVKTSAIGAIFQSIDYRFLKKVGNDWVDLGQSKAGGIFDFFGIFPNSDGFTAKGLEPGEYRLEVANKNAAAIFGNISVDLFSTTKNTFGEAKIDNVKSIDGNVITDLDPVFGKDLVVSGAVVKAVNGVALNGLTSVKGEYGTLSIQSNGSYTYKPNSDLKAIGKTDVFNYTITDPVTGKSDTASLVVQIDSKSGGALAWSKFTPEANANDAQALANESAGKFNSSYLNETVSANGLDKLIFNVLNKNSQNGGNGVDTINDFKLGSNVKIDVSDLLSDDATSQNLNKFIFVEKDGNNTKLSIDRDGTGTTFSKVELITFNNTDVSLQELLNKNHLLF